MRPANLFVLISGTAETFFAATTVLGNYCVTTDTLILPFATSRATIFYSVHEFVCQSQRAQDKPFSSPLLLLMITAEPSQASILVL